jgi:hypothetical protein
VTVTLSPEASRAYWISDAVVGKYAMTGTSLTTTLVRQTVDGKPAPAQPKDVSAERDIVTFSDGGKTLTLHDTDKNHPPLMLMRQ